MPLEELPFPVLRVAAVVFGLIWGSFLNVVIHRVPRDESIVHPASRCPECGAPIRAWQNIPVLSYLALRGRAACCGARISPRYLVVEVLGGVLSLAIFEMVVARLAPETPAVHVAAVYASDFTLAMGLVAAAFIDAEHMFLPDTITLGGTIVGLGTASLRDLTYVESFTGALVGFVGVWLPFVFLYGKLRGRAGMGLGDAKLVMLAGAWFGWKGAAFAFFAGALQATVAAFVLYAVKGKIEEPESVRADREELEKAAAEGDEEAKKLLAEDPLGTPPAEGLMAARLSFGPFLILGCLEYLFFAPWLAERLAFL